MAQENKESRKFWEDWMDKQDVNQLILEFAANQYNENNIIYTDIDYDELERRGLIK